MDVLRVTGLCKNYGASAALVDLSLSIAAGESLAVIGHNGAGKTTLMKLILGLTRSSAGSIEHFDYSAGVQVPLQSRDSIGFLPEIVAFPGSLTGQQMLRFYARLKNESQASCEELLELVGLQDAAQGKINTYSKGMRQRLGLAQALLGRPPLLLLDEPTSGLDPFLRSHFYEIISTRQAAGAAIMISSHALTEIEAQTDRIAIMKNGRLLTQGSLGELRSKAALPVNILVNCQPGRQADLIQAISTANPPLVPNPLELRYTCTEEEKLSLLHRLTERRDLIADVVARAPGLDDLYTHFVNGDSE